MECTTHHEDRRAAGPAARCSSLITSGRPLDYIAPLQLELRENSGTLLLIFTENILRLTDNNLITSITAGIM
jgi:hypothetical protein